MTGAMALAIGIGSMSTVVMTITMLNMPSIMSVGSGK